MEKRPSLGPSKPHKAHAHPKSLTATPTAASAKSLIPRNPGAKTSSKNTSRKISKSTPRSGNKPSVATGSSAGSGQAPVAAASNAVAAAAVGGTAGGGPKLNKLKQPSSTATAAATGMGATAGLPAAAAGKTGPAVSVTADAVATSRTGNSRRPSTPPQSVAAATFPPSSKTSGPVGGGGGGGGSGSGVDSRKKSPDSAARRLEGAVGDGQPTAPRPPKGAGSATKFRTNDPSRPPKVVPVAANKPAVRPVAKPAGEVGAAAPGGASGVGAGAAPGTGRSGPMHPGGAVVDRVGSTLPLSESQAGKMGYTAGPNGKAKAKKVVTKLKARCTRAVNTLQQSRLPGDLETFKLKIFDRPVEDTVVSFVCFVLS